MFKGILGSFVIHLVSLGLAFGVAYLNTNEYQDGSSEVRLSDNEAVPADEVLLSLGDARSVLVMEWLLPIFLIGLLVTCVFLFRTDRASAIPTQRAKFLPMWVMLLISEFVIALVLMFVVLFSPYALFAMDPGNVPITIAVGIGLMMLGYVLSTVLFVKKLLVPSVPLATMARGN